MKNRVKQIVYPIIMMVLALVFFSSQGTEAEAAGGLSTGGSWNTNVETSESPVDPAAAVLSGIQTTSSNLNSRGYVPSFGGYIEITKYDSTKFKKLAGAQFTIYDSSGEVVEVITSNAYGVAKSSKLALGVYKVVETKAPDGYELESTPASIALKSCITVCLKKYNKPGCTGSLNVKKVDEEGKPLAGATFDVFNSSGTKVGTVTTDENGVAQLGNLPYGTYTLVETQAPDGYELDSTPIEVTISKTTLSPTAIVTNKKAKGNLEVIKVDEDGKSLAGAEFEVFDSTGTSVGTITIDADGKGELTGLPYGDYTLVETKAPEGYELDSTPIEVTISKETSTVVKTVVNKLSRGNLEVIKVDEDGKSLAGAEFEVFDSTGTSVGTITIDADGKGELTGLPYGDYTLVETKAPEGYELDATPIEVTISKETSTVVKTVVNKLSRGSLEVIKVDEDGKSLAGAEFEVFDSTGTSVGTITIDADGKGELTGLPYGDYTLVETKAPEGYELDATPIEVTISKETSTVVKTVVNKLSRGSLEVIKVDEDGKSLAGAEFEVFDSTGTSVGTITIDADGKGELTGLPYGDYTLVETKAPEGYELDATPIEVTISKETSTVVKTVVNKLSRGSLEVIKVDEDGKSLAGAEFEVFDSTGTSVGTITIDADGKGELTGLPYGDYTLVETKAPEGYELDATPIEVTISKETSTVVKTVVNKLSRGNLEVIKVDEDGKSLAGAEFEVFDSTGTSVGTITIDADGKGELTGLPYGDYTLVETKAPEGYELDATPIEVTISKETSTVVKTVVNKLSRGNLEVIKVDEDGKSLAGAEFEVFDSTGASVGTITIDADGKGELTGLPYGDYTLVETKAPEGYELDATPIPVTISKETSTVVKTVVNKLSRGSLEVIKVDEDGKSLAGAEFEVFDSTGTSVGTITIDADGKGELTGLPYGDYTLVETKAPEGYELDATPIPVTISKETSTVVKTVVNKLSRGSLEVIKVDEDGKSLAGAEFEVFDSTGTSVGTITIDADGKGELTGLPYGDYTLVETKAPEGYELDATPIEVTISKETSTVVKTVVNKLSRGSLEVIKTNEANESLAGAKFEVRDANDNVVGEIITGADGKGQLDNLPYGDYTLVEIEAPAGYELDPTPIPVTISKDNSVVSISVVNKETEAEKGSLKIVKYEKDSDPIVYLEGAVFEVYDEDMNLVGTYTTDSQGEILLNDLAPGTYYITETTAPPGYEEDVNFYPVTVVAGEVAVVRHPNTKITEPVEDTGHLQVIKYANDEEGNATTERLEGAVFEITGPNGYTTEVATNLNGEINLSNLPVGSYVVKEIEAPTGYELDTTDTRNAEVVKDTTTVVEFYNDPVPPVPDPGEIKITHIGQNHEDPSDYPNRLENVVYVITGPDGYSTTVTTNAAGEIDISDLAPGIYTISSVTLTAEQIDYYGGGSTYYEYVDGSAVVNGEFEIKSNETTEIVVKTDHAPRRRYTGRALIFVHSISTSVKGQKFSVIDNENKVTEVETNTFGQISTYLPVGEYKVVRTTDARIAAQLSRLPFADVNNMAAFSIKKDRLTIVNLNI